VKRRNAFTLIEILVVVVILAVLAAVVVPNVIGKIRDGKIAAAKADIAAYGTALDAYATDHGGDYPATDTGLQVLITKDGNDPDWKGPYLQNEASLRADPWGHPYQYTQGGPNGEAYFIVSNGDGGPGTPITTATVKANK
jgi:general secretion pathway protein G